MRYRRVRKRSFVGRIKEMSAIGLLIWINIIISVIAFISWNLFPDSINFFALKPSSILAGKYLWTLVLHMFTHGGIFHLFINMFVLWSLGGLCERIIGRKRFVWFYMISGIFAGLLSAVLAGFYGFGFWEKVLGSPDIFMVGASGAIFAIAGLFVLLLPRLKFFIIFFPFVSFPAYVIVPAILILTWIASVAAGLPIGNVAHFGGFLVGIIYGYYLRTKYRKKVTMLQRYFR